MDESQGNIRAFFAIELANQETLDQLFAYQKELQKSIGPLKLVRPAQMHITLRFLGNISIQEAKSLYQFLESDINNTHFPPGKVYPSAFEGVGDFGKRVFFAKIKGNSAFLQQLNQQIEAKLTDFPSIKAENKPFKPHLTLARAKRSRKTRNPPSNAATMPQNAGQLPYSELKHKYSQFHFGPWIISKVVLKKSVLTPQGPIYSNLSF